MERFEVVFGPIHEHHQKESQAERQADDAVTLFALIFDIVVFDHRLIRVAEDFLRRLERNSMEPEVCIGLCRIP